MHIVSILNHSLTWWPTYRVFMPEYENECILGAKWLCTAWKLSSSDVSSWLAFWIPEMSLSLPITSIILHAAAPPREMKNYNFSIQCASKNITACKSRQLHMTCTHLSPNNPEPGFPPRLQIQPDQHVCMLWMQVNLGADECPVCGCPRTATCLFADQCCNRFYKNIASTWAHTIP